MYLKFNTDSFLKHIGNKQLLSNSFKSSLSKVIGFDPSKEKVVYQKLLKKAKSELKKENEVVRKEVLKTVDSNKINGFENKALDVMIDENDETTKSGFLLQYLF